MLNNDFNGKGEPREDMRLSLSGTTTAGEQQYRMWHDSQQILVPRGQSISKPYSSENVSTNVGVFGNIKKGFFQSPIVEFRNTIDYKLFDRFKLSIFREEFPTDPNIDLETLGFSLIDIRFMLNIDWYTYHWEIPKLVTLIKVDTNIFQSADSYQITTYTPFYSQGLIEYEMEISTYFNIDMNETNEIGNLPFGNHKLYMGLQNLKIKRGSSEYIYNQIFNKNIPNIIFSANNIEILRGWS